MRNFFGGVRRIIGFLVLAIVAEVIFAITCPELWLMCNIIIDLVLLPVSLCVLLYGNCLLATEIYKAYRKFINPAERKE